MIGLLHLFATPKILENNNFDLSNFCKLFTWNSKYNQSKAYKKIYKELILIAWHPLGWWDLCLHEYEK